MELRERPPGHEQGQGTTDIDGYLLRNTLLAITHALRHEHAGDTPQREKRSKLRIGVYLLRAEDGVPGVTRTLANATTIYCDIDLKNDANSGFAYCYASLRIRSRESELLIPNYFQRQFVPILMESRFLGRQRIQGRGPDRP